MGCSGGAVHAAASLSAALSLSTRAGSVLYVMGKDPAV